jgi:hypothetical protein
MIRYAIETVGTGHNTRWDSIGRGTTADPQHAHLFTTHELAEKKLQHYLNQPICYRSARIVEVEVSGL